MKRRGSFSLFIYTLYTVICVGLTIYCKIGLDRSQSGSGEGWEGLGYALILILAIVCGAAALTGVILKLLHIGTGFFLFGILCMLLDLGYITFCIYAVLPGGNNFSAVQPQDFLPVLLPIGISVASFISNARSLKSI